MFVLMTITIQKMKKKKDKEERNEPYDARLSSDGAAEVVIGGGRVNTS